MGHSHWVNTVIAIGKTAVTVSNDKTVRMWNPSGGACLSVSGTPDAESGEGAFLSRISACKSTQQPSS